MIDCAPAPRTAGMNRRVARSTTERPEQSLGAIASGSPEAEGGQFCRPTELCGSIAPLGAPEPDRFGAICPVQSHKSLAYRKRGEKTADYAACATGSPVCGAQFQGMRSSHRAAGQSAAIFPVTSAM